MNQINSKRFVLFAYGFRPFFLLAGFYALVAVAVWLWTFANGTAMLNGTAARFWHGHEMVFGFFMAAITGFLLTAVPSWTGRRGFAGAPLMLLALLWFAGRVVLALVDVLPWSVVVIVELLFLPAVMLTVGPSLTRTINRNTPLMFVLLALWIADAVFLYGLKTGDARLITGALRGGLDMVLVLVTVIGGRIVPAFTGNALKASGLTVKMRSRPVVERIVIPAMLVYAAGDVLSPLGWPTAVIAALAALLQLWRLSGWHGLRTTGQPIVWVLHLAYLWLPAGLLLKAIFIATGWAWSAHWQHALGAGAAATMIMAVMTRASLGHTGRKLQVHASIAVAYLLLVLSALLRVIGPAVLPFAYQHTMLVAGACWVLSFAIYLVIYTPILLGPRADGKPG